MVKPISINLIGGPGSGKSTSAANIFSYLKDKDCNVELITEYAKQCVYESSPHKLRNQFYITAKQYKKMRDIADYGVPMLITDSPLLISLAYCKNSHYFPEFKALLHKIDSEFENINVLVQRAKKYNPSGRMQSEPEAIAIDEEFKALIPFHYTLIGRRKEQESFAEMLIEKYGDRIKI